MFYWNKVTSAFIPGKENFAFGKNSPPITGLVYTWSETTIYNLFVHVFWFLIPILIPIINYCYSLFWQLPDPGSWNSELSGFYVEYIAMVTTTYSASMVNSSISSLSLNIRSVFNPVAFFFIGFQEINWGSYINDYVVSDFAILKFYR